MGNEFKDLARSVFGEEEEPLFTEDQEEDGELEVEVELEEDEEGAEDAEEEEAELEDEDEDAEEETQSASGKSDEEPDWARMYRLTKNPDYLPSWVKGIGDSSAGQADPAIMDELRALRAKVEDMTASGGEDDGLPAIDDSTEERFQETLDARIEAIAARKGSEALTEIQKENQRREMIRRAEEIRKETKALEGKLKAHDDWSDDVEFIMMDLASTQPHWAAALQTEAGTWDLFHQAASMAKSAKGEERTATRRKTAARKGVSRSKAGTGRASSETIDDSRPTSMRDAALQGIEDWKKQR